MSNRQMCSSPRAEVLLSEKSKLLLMLRRVPMDGHSHHLRVCVCVCVCVCVKRRILIFSALGKSATFNASKLLPLSSILDLVIGCLVPKMSLCSLQSPRSQDDVSCLWVLSQRK